jgi:hypothetical protein
MRKAILIPVLALTAFGLAGCGKKARNEAIEANESMPGDSNTMGEAVADVNAAQDAAFNEAEASYAGNGAAADDGGATGNEITD